MEIPPNLEDGEYWLPSDLLQEILYPSMHVVVEPESLPTRSSPKIDTSIEDLANKLQNHIGSFAAKPDWNGFSWYGEFDTPEGPELTHPQNLIPPTQNQDFERTVGAMVFLEKPEGTGVFLPRATCSSSIKEFENQTGRTSIFLSNKKNKIYSKNAEAKKKTCVKEKGVERKAKESPHQPFLSLSKEWTY
ncbi:hypothetical protein SLEP1_g5376 [Rubroshorea leprosula]|uniref:Uncharacterized protein n=1 Tax=Rubroshorea leprosula TaxID=152421 RepID=A0AAV5HY32_9ROSI|nr:hypothetical protein SLEP1_g5376 [Rubroshorea leprosula]